MSAGKTMAQWAEQLASARDRTPRVTGVLGTVASIAGVDYMELSAGATLDGTLQAISGLGKPLVWIADAGVAGSLDERVMELLHAHVDAVVFHGKADPALVDAWSAGSELAYFTPDLRTAVFTARELAVQGGKVLFCPDGPALQETGSSAGSGKEYRLALKDL
ncbi:MAG: hypothetical protein M9900_09550 [Flavobacteriales bacterium]|nr:hypothetical protein [Flavobacteriales bacterium]